MDDPFSTQPEDDSGAATQDRFSWQHHCIAVDRVGLIVAGQTRRVVGEIHEDYIVEHRDGLCELVSCKHREASRGPWKLVDLCIDGGVGHLFGRWSAFPQTLLRLMTNGGLAAGKAEAGAVAIACAKAAVAGGVAVPDGAGGDGLAGGCGAVEAQPGGDDRGGCLREELAQAEMRASRMGKPSLRIRRIRT